MIIENREFEWAVQIDSDHAVNIRWAKWNGQEVTSDTIANGITPGLNNTPIYLALEERWLALG